MKYDDFPILKNDDYQLLREQYLALNQTDRKSLINEICQEISKCINSFWLSKNIFNHKLNLSIKDCQLTLGRLLDNLTSLFNIQTNNPQSISNFSLFAFVKKISTIISMLHKWLSIEQKEYYKVTILKTIDELLNALNNIFSAAEESNIKFYKHM